jgi:signal transduction histidine kinase
MSRKERGPAPDGLIPATWLESGEIAGLLRSGAASIGLGPVPTWPASLRTTLDNALASQLPMAITWGADSRLLYNDAFRPLLGRGRHPEALGGPVAQVFPELWSALGPAFERVRSGEAVEIATWYLPLARNGDFENRWLAVFPAAVRDAADVICGVLAVFVETTARIDTERRMSTLRDLALAVAPARTPEAACAAADKVLGENAVDIPFGAIYLVADGADHAVRAGAFGLPDDHPSIPRSIPLDADAPDGIWPISRVVRTGKPETLTDVGDHVLLPGGPYPEPSHGAVLIPLGLPGFERPAGVLVAGVSPRRNLDPSYLEFFALAAAQLACSVRRGRMIHAARGPMHAIAAAVEIDGLQQDLDRALAKARVTRRDTEANDRANDEFLARLGHELRDPLAPMSAVLRLMRDDSGLDDVFPKEREILERQLARLSELVDELRDVSRMTRGGIELARCPVALDVVVERAMEMSAAILARRHHRVDASLVPTGLQVEGDATHMAQAIAGLLTSAVRHASEGSVVELRARRDVDEAILTIRHVPHVVEPPAAELLDDSGAPPRASAAQHPDRGMGVGFPILRNIIALHGGSVRAAGEDAADGFDVHLPLSGLHDLPRPEGQDTAA